MPPRTSAQVKALDALLGGVSLLALIAGGDKTRIIYELARALQARLTFVVTPAIAVTSVWPPEGTRWAPDVEVVPLAELRAGRPLPAGRVLIVTSPDLLVASKTAREIALALPIDLLCADEGHMLKSPDARRTRFVYGELTPRARRTIAMSGNFVLNSAAELFTHLHALAPEKIADYPTYDKFTKHFCTFGRRHVPGRAQPIEVITGSNTAAFPELREMLAGVMFKLPRAEVEAGLPSRRTRMVPLRLDPVDAAAVSDLERSPEADQLRAAIASGDLQAVDGHLSRIRRIFSLVKVNGTVAWAEAALNEGEPAVLIFGWHVEALEQIHVALASHGAALITGSTPAKARDAAVRRLQAGEVKILVAQIGAAGTAITLTRARRVVFAELAWTPALNEQAAKRAHRTGQTHPVLVDILTVPDSIDAAVAGVLAKKLAEIAALEAAA